HDYGPNGRDIRWETTVGDERRFNIHVGAGKTREEFIKFRTERDAQLDMPRLILPSLQVNMRAGQLPKDQSGRLMLKVPLNGL
ncbi:MAG TPA: MBL fold metallo-hydrolase, partial [Thalassospira sp.]|nr:MBL fold metallo-hydrolase [Thalassospira sp.]